MPQAHYVTWYFLILCFLGRQCENLVLLFSGDIKVPLYGMWKPVDVASEYAEKELQHRNIVVCVLFITCMWVMVTARLLHLFFIQVLRHASDMTLSQLGTVKIAAFPILHFHC